MAMVLEVISMLKKLSLSVLAVLLLCGGVVAVKFVIPMYVVLDKVGPGTAPRDLAQQDDGKVVPPYLNAYAEPDGELPAAGNPPCKW